MSVAYKIIGGDGREYGPVNLEEIRGWCEEGRVGVNTPVWRDDELRWQPARSREELRWDLPAPPPEAPAPTPTAAPRPSPSTLPSAGFAIRLAAAAYDLLIIHALISLITSPWSDKMVQLNNVMMEQSKSANPDLQVFFHAWLILAGIFVPVTLLYSVLFTVTQGATPGKRVLGLRVTRSDGTPITWNGALLRYAAQWLSVIPFGFGFALILVTRGDLALHDYLAKTRVVWMRRG
jgi:uncharacterized RDD family membrane protein YckC